QQSRGAGRGVAGDDHQLCLGGEPSVRSADVDTGGDALPPHLLEPRRPDRLPVLQAQLGSVVDRHAGGDVVPRAPEHAAEPVVEHLFQVREVDGLVDVLVRVDVAPANLDALLVHGGIGYETRWRGSRTRSRSSRGAGGESARPWWRASRPREPRSGRPILRSTTTFRLFGWRRT